MENPLPLETQPVPRKPRRFLIVGGVILAVLVVAAVSVYTWFAVYGPCGRGTVDTASAALIDQLKAFEADFQSAASINPIGLIGPVTHMEQTLWDTREVVVPACMQAAKNELATSIESEIRAYLAIMSQKPDKTIKKLKEDAKTHLENFADELEAVNRCAPFCL
jgi:hypothetical protein